MIDPKAVRAHPDALREAIRVRKVDPAKANVDRWLVLNAARQQLQRDIAYLRGDVARMQYALSQLLMDELLHSRWWRLGFPAGSRRIWSKRARW